MKWESVPLERYSARDLDRVIAPLANEVWQLNLDQIESHTGRVLEKVVAPVRDAGNSTYSFAPGTVLYSKLRPYLNKVVVADDFGIATTELVPLRPDPRELEPKFLAYFLRSPEFLSFATSCVAGAKMPRMIMSKFWHYRVPKPPLPEQRRIVEILDEADRLRKLRADADAKAERILPALFIKMFGDPRLNPMNWPLRTLSTYFAEKPNYGTMMPPTTESRTWLDIRVKNISGDSLDLEDKKYVDLAEHDLARHTLRDGDLIIARAIGSLDHLGKCAVVYPGERQWAFDSHVMRVRLQQDLLRSEYVWAFLNSGAGRQEFLRHTRNSVVQFNINVPEFGAIQIPVPPPALQSAFSRHVRHLWDMREERRESVLCIQHLFSLIAARAFAGTLRGDSAVRFEKIGPSRSQLRGVRP